MQRGFDTADHMRFTKQGDVHVILQGPIWIPQGPKFRSHQLYTQVEVHMIL